MYKRILLAYDGSESGQKALLDCHDIAQWSHAELFLVAERRHLAPTGGDDLSDVQGRAPVQPESQREPEHEDRLHREAAAEGVDAEQRRQAEHGRPRAPETAAAEHEEVAGRVEAAEVGKQETRGVANAPVGVGTALQDLVGIGA